MYLIVNLMILITRHYIGHWEKIEVIVEGKSEGKAPFYEKSHYCCSLIKVDKDYLVEDMEPRMRRSHTYDVIDNPKDMIYELQRFMDLVRLLEKDPLKAELINSDLLLALTSLND